MADLGNVLSRNFAAFLLARGRSGAVLVTQVRGPLEGKKDQRVWGQCEAEKHQ